MQEFIKQNEEMLQAVQKRAGIDSEKVQKTVSSYLQIARDNQGKEGEREVLTLQARIHEIAQWARPLLPSLHPEFNPQNLHGKQET